MKRRGSLLKDLESYKDILQLGCKTLVNTKICCIVTLFTKLPFYRATLDLQIKHAQSEYKTQYELQARRARDKDKELRTLQIAEKHLKIGEDQLNLEKQRHENYRDELDSFNR